VSSCVHNRASSQRFAFVCAIAAIGVGVARAQDAGAPDFVAPDAGDAPPAVQAPEVATLREAEYPAEALAMRIEAAVVLRLSIDADGHVSGAEIVEGAGHGFDEAAQAAALEIVFKPARRGDDAVASRILYRYEFHLPPPAAPIVEAPTPPARPPLPAPSTALEVSVIGTSAVDRHRQSAEAVTIIDTEQAQRRSADLGEVLARSQGIGVRRSGGLGSSTRFSLNGLTDEQVRFFLDGVPLELMGYPFGVANVPLNLIEHVEIYSGVVPIRFGADALGGALNLVTDQDLSGTHAGASYGAGAFDTHRATLSAQHLHQPSGFFTRLNGFFDYSANDYPIDVEAPDAEGQPEPVRVHRFHDDYRAAGGNLELGFVDRPWAKRLLLRGFLTDYDKQYQHNLVMTIPYGGVTYGETSFGGSLQYEQRFAHGMWLDAIAGYAHTRGEFWDAATCVYDWFGRCGRKRATRGETDVKPHDQSFWDNTGFGRFNFGWRTDRHNSLRLAIVPTYVTRTGDERLQRDPKARDPLTALRNLGQLVTGLEYELDAIDTRLENIAFVKHYLQVLDSEEVRPGNVFRARDRTTNRFGVGDGVRYRFVEGLFAKLSYEYATRLPRPDELFGDNAFIYANLTLKPEVSHNLNLGLLLDARESRAGAFRGSVNGFLREANNLIVLLGSDRQQTYQNVYGARALGVEAAAGWTSLGEHVVLDANLTYQGFRNTSSKGTFGNFEGDNIPNRPYFFANAAATLQARGVATEHDQLALLWNTHYVHEFFRGWESAGLRAYKDVIETQLVHTVGVDYLVNGDPVALSFTVEVQNLTDQPAFDFYGVQRPGRAFYIKTTAEL
jgi:vitamin B12 transporter